MWFLGAPKAAFFVKRPVRKKRIVYWAFCIDITRPKYTKSKNQRARKKLSRKQLQEIEELAARTAQSKLPPGFRAEVS